MKKLMIGLITILYSGAVLASVSVTESGNLVTLSNEKVSVSIDKNKARPRGPLKTTYDSAVEWSRYKGPKMVCVYTFIDKDKDGKIDSDEHQAFEDYKNKHSDWQKRARKKLGIESP